MYVCPKNSSRTVNGSDLKFAQVMFYAILRSTVLFSIFNFQGSNPSPNRVPPLNSGAIESKELNPNHLSCATNINQINK